MQFRQKIFYTLSLSVYEHLDIYTFPLNALIQVLFKLYRVTLYVYDSCIWSCMNSNGLEERRKCHIWWMDLSQIW